MNYTGYVRRIDLHLRGIYPELTTIIYQTEEQKFLIYCEDVHGDFEDFRNNFNGTIRFIATPVDVSLEKPTKYLRTIDAIEDKEIPKRFEGVIMNLGQFFNTLQAKFPNIYFHKIKDDGGLITIYTATFEEKIGNDVYLRFLNNDQRRELEKFLNELNWPIKFLIIEEKRPCHPDLDISEVEHSKELYASSLGRKTRLKCFIRDEALWLDNIDKIFEGSFTKNDLYFYKPGEYSCYLDYSLYDNIDIRNLLFLYQVIYLSPPVNRSIAQWLTNLKLKQSDLLELISGARLKIVLPYDAHKYDFSFLSSVLEVNPNALITRKALDALMQIDIVNIADDYLFNDIKIIKELRAISSQLADNSKLHLNYQAIFKLLIWPIQAKRKSFSILNHGGIISVPSFGANKIIEKELGEIVDKDVELGFLATSSTIHLANALNVTYFPYRTKNGFTDAFYANALGGLLNFYKMANSARIGSLLRGQNEFNNSVSTINPIEVFEVNNYISIRDLEEALPVDFVGSNGKRLIETLANLSEDDRTQKIRYYNKEVNQKLNNNKRNAPWIDLGIGGLEDIIGNATGFPALGLAGAILKLAGSRLFKSKSTFRGLLDKLESSIHSDADKANIHYLTSINRVARIKEYP